MQTVTQKDLWPGVHFTAVHTTKFKSSVMSVTLMTQLDRETAGANALVPCVLRRGTADHPDMESLSAALDELYGGSIEPVVRKKGETQCVGLVSSFLDDAYALNGERILEPAAALLGEVLLRPYTADGAFCPDYTAGERANLIDRIRGQINDKRVYATKRLIQEMCRDERFGTDKLGDEETVAAVTPQSLWARYQELLRTAEVHVYYCGSAEPERAEAALRSALAALPVSGDREEPGCEIRCGAAFDEPRVVEESLDVSQGKLAMGFRTGGQSCWDGKDYPALVMMNTIFGGTALSKLFLNVREKLSLCYFTSSSLEKFKGIIVVSSGIEFANYEKAKAEILAQLENCRTGTFEDWEREGARRAVVSAMRTAMDAQGRLEDYWLGQAVAGLAEPPKDLVDRVEAVTRDQVVAVAKKMELDTIYFLKGKED